MRDRGKTSLGSDATDAVLFDLDGTLMDTDDQMVEGLALWLQRMGWPRLYRSARRLVMMAETPVNGLMTVLDALGLDGPMLGVWNWLRGMRTADQVEYRLMKDAKGMLIDLNQRYQLAIVTTRGREDAEAFLTCYGLSDLFCVIVTREDTWRLKPHPAPIFRAAHRLRVPAERCVMVGDTSVDVRSAQRAGARAVGVTCGFGERDELERAGADVVLAHVSDLSSLL